MKKGPTFLACQKQKKLPSPAMGELRGVSGASLNLCLSYENISSVLHSAVTSCRKGWR